MKDVFTFGGFHIRAVDGGSLMGANLFRSSSLINVTSYEASFLTNTLHIRSIYDLRSKKEIASNPEPRIIGTKTVAFEPALNQERSDASRRLVAGVIGEYGYPEERMIFNYRRYADEFFLMGKILRTIASEQIPSLVHCEHGKDRTGVLCAVLLRIAGFSQDDIMTTYLDTNRVNAEDTAREIAELGLGMTNEEHMILLSFLEARPAYLHAFFNEIDSRPGGFSGYVQNALCLTKQQVESLCALLAR